MFGVSIIVPVYNVENYLDKCLYSCVNQTMDNIEVIIVDDASTDGSSEIIEKYHKNYPFIVKVIRNVQNLGLGLSRNVGLEVAESDNIFFLDADDYIELNTCEVLYKKKIEKECDIVYCERDCIEGENVTFIGVYRWYDFCQKDNLMNFHSACHMLISKQLIVENGLIFPPQIVHEDLSVTPLWYLLASRVEYIELPLYHQVIRQSSITHTLDFAHSVDLLATCVNLIKNAKRLGLLKKHKAALDCYVLDRISFAICLLSERVLHANSEDIAYLNKIIIFWQKYSFCLDSFYKRETSIDIKKIYEFINNPIPYLRGYDTYYKQRVNEFCDVLSDLEYSVVVYGYGKRALPLIEVLLQNERLVYVVASDVSDDCEIREGRKIYSLEYVKKHVTNPFFIITSEIYGMEMINNLLKLGFDKNYIRLKVLTEYFMSVDKIMNGIQ